MADQANKVIQVVRGFRNRLGDTIGDAILVPPGHSLLQYQVLKFEGDTFAKGSRTMSDGRTAYFKGDIELVADEAITPG